MRRVVLLAALLLALPVALFADSTTDFQNLGSIGSTATVSTLTPTAGGTLSLTSALSGGASGTFTNGSQVEVKGNGIFILGVMGNNFTGQLIAHGVVSGDTIVVTPEPGTLGLLGTGLVGIAGLVRRKFKAA